ncbi:glycosyltransferase [Arthrobacter sp.]|uniref:glycosyltransferase n=1 Tax=Arthrobacter sp. TaxID=1667 RepID=UPI003A8D6862
MEVEPTHVSSLYGRRVLLALNTGARPDGPNAEWQWTLISELIGEGAAVTISLPCPPTDEFAMTIGALELESVLSRGKEDQRDSQGWLQPRFHARSIIEEAERLDPEIVIAHGYELTRTLAGAGKLKRILWSIISDETTGKVDFAGAIEKHLPALAAGSRRLVVFSEDQRSFLEGTAPEATGKTSVFPVIGHRFPEAHKASYDDHLPVALVIRLGGDTSSLLAHLGDIVEHFKCLTEVPRTYLVGTTEQYRAFRGQKEYPLAAALPGAKMISAEAFHADELSRTHRLIGLHGDERDASDDPGHPRFWFGAHGLLVMQAQEAAKLFATQDVEYWKRFPFLDSSADLWKSAPVWHRGQGLAAFAEPLIADYITIPPRESPLKVLLVGADFKFAGDLVDGLYQRRDIDLKVDLWANNSTPQPEISNPLLAWADVIICEFSSINAIWYSNHVRPGQRLIVRLHGYELLADWIHKLNFTAVDTMVFVSEFYRDKAIKKMGWDRARTAVIPNTIHADDLDRPKLDDARFHIGIAGIVPILKRPDRALDLLELLLQHDDRYTLHIRGNEPWNYNWEWRKPEHRDAYREFYRRIGADEYLRRHIAFESFGPDMGNWFRRIGWMLSPSYRETFHLAPVEGMASGAIPVVWDREGANEIFPTEHVHQSTKAAAARILELNADPATYAAAAVSVKESAARYDAATVRSQWLRLLGQPAARRGGATGAGDASGELAFLVEELQKHPSTQTLLTACTQMWQDGQYEATLGLLDDHISLTARASGAIKDFENWVRGVFLLEARSMTLVPPSAAGPVYRPTASSSLLVRTTQALGRHNPYTDAPLASGLVTVDPPAFLEECDAGNGAASTKTQRPRLGDPALVGHIAADSSLRFNHYVNKIAAEIGLISKAQRASRLVVDADVWLALPTLMAGQRLGIPVVWDIRNSPQAGEKISIAVADQFVHDPLALLSRRVASRVSRLLLKPEQLDGAWTLDADLLPRLLPDRGAGLFHRELESLRTKSSADVRVMAHLRIGLVSDQATVNEIAEWASAVPLTSENFEAEIENGLDAVIVDTSADLPDTPWSGRIGHEGTDRGASIVALLTACRVGGIRSIFWNRHDKNRYPQYWGVARKTDLIVTNDVDALPSYLRMNPAVHESAICAINSPKLTVVPRAMPFSERSKRIGTVDPIGKTSSRQAKQLALRLRDAGHKSLAHGADVTQLRFGLTLAPNDGSDPQGASAWSRTMLSGTPLLSPGSNRPRWDAISRASGMAERLAHMGPSDLTFASWHRLLWSQLVDVAQGNSIPAVLTYILRSVGIPVENPETAPFYATAATIGYEEATRILTQTVLPDGVVSESFEEAPQRMLEEAGIQCKASTGEIPDGAVVAPVPPAGQPDFYDRVIAWMSLTGASQIHYQAADETAPLWGPLENGNGDIEVLRIGTGSFPSFSVQLLDPMSPARIETSGGDREFMSEDDGLTAGVSVVIPTYLGVDRISAALESLAHQSLARELAEIVVVGNGPEDGSREIVEEFRVTYPDIQTRYFHLPEASVAAARNEGVKHARRESIVFVDDDDRLEKNYLLSLWLRSAPATMVLGRLHDVEETGEVRVETASTNRANELGSRVLPLFQRAGALGLNGAKLLPTYYARVCSYDPKLRSGEDVAYMAQLLRFPEIRVTAAVPMEDDAYLRVLRPESISRRDLTYEFSVQERLDVIATLRQVKSESGTKASRGAADYLATGQAQFIKRYLGEHPDEHIRVEAEIVERGLSSEPALRTLVD